MLKVSKAGSLYKNIKTERGFFFTISVIVHISFSGGSENASKSIFKSIWFNLAESQIVMIHKKSRQL